MLFFFFFEMEQNVYPETQEPPNRYERTLRGIRINVDVDFQYSIMYLVYLLVTENLNAYHSNR